MTNDQSQLIVCERGNEWAVALRRVLSGLRVRVYETRTWQAAVDALSAGQTGH